MITELRPLRPDDAAAVLAINHEVVHHLAPLDAAGYAWFLEHGAASWAAEVDGELAGFVLLLDPGLDYDSANYRWFSERYDAFVYLDRVAIGAGHRRRGVGSALYDAVEEHARQTGRPVLLEVNLDPPNEPSLAFHDGRGYRRVAIFTHPGDKVVQMYEKTAPIVHESGNAHLDRG